MKYAAIIYDSMNVIVKVEERPTIKRAYAAARICTPEKGWFRITDNEEDIELAKTLINA